MELGFFYIVLKKYLYKTLAFQKIIGGYIQYYYLYILVAISVLCTSYRSALDYLCTVYRLDIHIINQKEVIGFSECYKERNE